MSSPFATYKEYVVAPGARERIEKRLKDIPEINANRPCYKCAHFNPYCVISCRSTKNCNFNHDNFTESLY